MARRCAKIIARCRCGIGRALIHPREQQALAVCCVGGEEIG